MAEPANRLCCPIASPRESQRVMWKVTDEPDQSLGPGSKLCMASNIFLNILRPRKTANETLMIFNIVPVWRFMEVTIIPDSTRLAYTQVRSLSSMLKIATFSCSSTML